MKRFVFVCIFSLLLAQGWSQTEPTVTTNPKYARGSTEAFCRATFKAIGSNTIKTRGFVYSSTNPEPSLDADLYTETTLSNNGLIYRLQNLTPATIYYARPYAKAADGAVGYGAVIKFSTLPTGSITWSYDDGGDANQNARIRSAVDGCVNYWNQYTSIPGLHLNVHYGAQTPTADCSYGGWMRIGPNESYQRVGTVMHEALHAIGVGQHDLWYGQSSPLRAGSGTGQWLGDRATELVRFWDNSQTAIVNGDITHVWPYGINGAHEDNGTEQLYIGCSLLAQALAEDGLPPVAGKPYGLAHYSFSQDDNERYYLKNEAENYGLLTSYLVEDSNNHLVWQNLTAVEALSNDAAAWYITFNPANQCYSLKNAATGRYMSYVSNGINGIETVSKSTPASTEMFQMMRGRINPTDASGNAVTTHRGYWMFNPDNGECLTATTNGAVTTSAFNLADNQTKQRWVILTSSQALDMENSGLISTRTEITSELNEWSQIANVPHVELVEGVNEQFANTLSTLSQQVDQASSIAQLNDLRTQLSTAGKLFLSGVCASGRDELFDLTFLLVNPDFTNGATGWSGYITSTAAINYNEAEFYQTSATAMQTIKEMPRGSYRLTMQGFQRPGSYTDVYNAYQNGTSTTNAKLYLQLPSKGVYLKNIMDDRSSSSLHADSKRMADGTYIPNTMASASAFFKKGFYNNLIEYFTEAGDLKIGLIGTGNTASSYWTCFTNFRLYYIGALTLEEIDALSIEELHASEEAETVYNLSGMRVRNADKGFYVINRKKVLIK